MNSIPNANDIVREENRFNDPPRPGGQFFLARVRVRNVGSEFLEYDPGLDLNAIGSQGVAYETFGATSRCGVIPEDCTDTTLAPGGVFECNLCWQIEAAEAPTVLMFRDRTAPQPETGEPLFWDLVP